MKSLLYLLVALATAAVVSSEVGLESLAMGCAVALAALIVGSVIYEVRGLRFLQKGR